MDITQILDPVQIDKLFRAKVEYGQLFLFSSPKYLTVFRPLTIAETEALTSLSEKLHQCAVEDWIFSTCFVIGSREKNYFLYRGPFGYVSHIASKIPIVSHIQEEKEYNKTVLLSREKNNTLQNLVETIITKVYGGSINVKNLTQKKQFELLAKAEAISGDTLDIRNKDNKKALREFTKGATVLGGTEKITDPRAADIPDFNESF